MRAKAVLAAEAGARVALATGAAARAALVGVAWMALAKEAEERTALVMEEEVHDARETAAAMTKGALAAKVRAASAMEAEVRHAQEKEVVSAKAAPVAKARAAPKVEEEDYEKAVAMAAATGGAEQAMAAVKASAAERRPRGWAVMATAVAAGLDTSCWPGCPPHWRM